MARKNISGADFANRVISGATASKFAEGVGRTQGSPTAKAADSIQRMASGWNEAMSSGRIEAGLRKVSEAEWKSKTAAKAGNYVTGLGVNKSRIAEGGARLMSHVQSGYAELDNLPKGRDHAVERATFWIEHMKKMKNK